MFLHCFIAVHWIKCVCMSSSYFKRTLHCHISNMISIGSKHNCITWNPIIIVWVCRTVLAKWQELTREWGWLTMARMEMDYNVDKFFLDAFEVYQKIMLQSRICFKNSFLFLVTFLFLKWSEHCPVFLSVFLLFVNTKWQHCKPWK